MRSDTPAWIVAPGGEAQPIEYKNAPLDEKTQPLVSCLMVTRGDVQILRHSLECYLKQDYPRRELIVVSKNPAVELERFLDAFPDAGIRLVKTPGGLSVGELRNISIEHARGAIVCQWNDDDLSDPRRITTSVNVLLSSKAAAFFLSRWLVWWPERGLIALSQHRPWGGSMVAFKDIVPRFPAVDRHEDTFVVEAISQDHSIAVLEMPWLYCHTVTGLNDSREPHFERMIRDAAAVFSGDEYAQGVERLARRIPIRQYAEALERRRREIRLLNGSGLNAPLQFDVSELRPEHSRQPQYAEVRENLHITVGVPLYHSWDCIVPTLRSIECQTYQNMTVVISADANDQRSADACRPFLADPRFRLTVQPERLGWVGNMNWLMSQAEGDYFCYHQHDDHTDPTYFATLVEAARREPQAASVYCDIQHFGGRTEVLAQESILGTTAFARLLLQIADLNYASIHGIINCQAIREAGPIQLTEFDGFGVDIVWVAKLLRWGDIVRVPHPLYFKLIDPETVHGKWFRWERAQRREPWIGLLLGLLEVGQSVAETPEQEKQLLQAIVNRLAPAPTEWAFYQTESRAERVQLIEEFIERTGRKGSIREKASLRPVRGSLVFES